ncbi:MAG TPA: hypothetical protein VGM58_09995, partial [Verrucomicrobiae bacterium]
FVQFLKDHSIRHVAIDTDNENSTLKRFHPEAVFVDLSQSSGIDRIFVEVSAQQLVVVDCRAASTDIFLRYFNQLGAFEALKELNASLTLVLPVSHDADSTKQVQVLSEQFGDNANYVVVKNRLFCDQFDIYDKSKTHRRIMDELGGKEIEMPVLCDWLVVALNQSASTISTALRGSKFFIMDRQRLKFWQRDFEEQIEIARDLLLPERKRKGASHE